MIDNTDTTSYTDPTSLLNSQNGGIVAGADPGSWVGVTGTLPADLPPANIPGSPQQLAAAAAGGSSTTTTAATAGISSSTKLALALGAGVLVLGFLALSSSPRRR